MKFHRRDFLKTSAAAAGALALADPYAALASSLPGAFPAEKMKLTFRPYTLELKHLFTVAVSSRTTTPVVLTEIYMRQYNRLRRGIDASLSRRVPCKRNEFPRRRSI